MRHVILALAIAAVPVVLVGSTFDGASATLQHLVSVLKG